MKRAWLAIALGIGLKLVACTRGEEGASGSGPALSAGAPTAVAASHALAPTAAQAPIMPVLPEAPRGDNTASCLALVAAEKYDVALRPCLLALQADPSNERLIAAVKQIQTSVTNPRRANPPQPKGGAASEPGPAGAAGGAAQP